MGPQLAEHPAPGKQAPNRGSVTVTFFIAAPTAEIRSPTNQMCVRLSRRATCAVLTQHSLLLPAIAPMPAVPPLPAIPPIALDGWGTRFSSASLDSQVLLP